MAKNSIEKLARQAKFIQRKSKLDALYFLNSLMFAHQQGKTLSLLDHCGDLYCQENLLIKKQSIVMNYPVPRAQGFLNVL